MRNLLLCLVPAVMLMTACDGTGPATDTTPTEKSIAEVNGEPITESRLDSYAERRTGSDPATLEPQLRKQLLDELINIELLAQVAEKDRLHEKSPLKEQLVFQRETAMADAAMTRYLEEHPVTDEDVKAEYEKRKGELGGTEYKARHILLESEAMANDVIAKLEGGEDFTELAKAHSIEPGADQSGGDLGWFSPAQMVPPFAAAVTSMQPGERSKVPVQTQFGWHVIAVEDTREVPPPVFEQVAPQIQRFMTSQRIQEYINELRAGAEIVQAGDAAEGADPDEAGAAEETTAAEPDDGSATAEEAAKPEA